MTLPPEWIKAGCSAYNLATGCCKLPCGDDCSPGPCEQITDDEQRAMQAALAAALPLVVADLILHGRQPSGKYDEVSIRAWASARGLAGASDGGKEGE